MKPDISAPIGGAALNLMVPSAFTLLSWGFTAMRGTGASHKHVQLDELP